MKTQLLIFVFATTMCVSTASLIDALNAVHQSPAFNNLSHPDQLLIIELVAETEAGELKNYVDSVGFHTVLAVIDKLPESEAHILTNYLMNELAREENLATTTPSTPISVIGRRSLVDVLNTAKSNAAFKKLSNADQQLIIDVLTAAENGTLTALIDQIGYSSVLRIISIMPVAEEHLFQHYLIQHLRAESGLLG